jgi:hypothetical protein
MSVRVLSVLLFRNAPGTFSFCAMRSHEWIDQRSLALDRLVAKKLRAQPLLLEKAKSTLARWISQREGAVPHVLLEWQDCLSQLSFGEILGLLIGEDERARRLRQSSPFCGILTQEERLAILKEYESRRA